jgi:hypothetical protein
LNETSAFLLRFARERPAFVFDAVTRPRATLAQ